MAARYRCGVCDAVCSTNIAFEEHIAGSHSSLILPVECHKFASEALFEEWRRDEEKKQIVRFSVRNSRKIPYFGKTSHYRCYRDGEARVKPPEDRKRKGRLQGPNRMNAHCPARFTKTVWLSGEVEVDYHPTHFGHDLELSRLPLPSTVKAKVAALVNKKIPSLAILEEIRESVVHQPISREHLLTMKDISNVIRDCKRWVLKSVPDGATNIDSREKQQEDDRSDVTRNIPKGTSYPRIEKDDIPLGTQIGTKSKQTVAKNMEADSKSKKRLAEPKPTACTSQTPPAFIEVSDDEDSRDISTLSDVYDVLISVKKSEAAKLISLLPSQDETLKEVRAGAIAELTDLLTAKAQQCTDSAGIRRLVRRVKEALEEVAFNNPDQQYEETGKLNERRIIDPQRKSPIKMKKDERHNGKKNDITDDQLQAPNCKIRRTTTFLFENAK